MLIVLAIVSLLLTLALPRYFDSLQKSKDVALEENLRVLRVSLDKFYSDKGYYPKALDELVDSKYLRSVPLDPVTESVETWVLIRSQNEEAPGIEDVKSGADGFAKDGRAYRSL